MAEFPKRPALSESITVRVSPAVKDLLISIGVEHEHNDLGSFVRAVFNNTIKAQRPKEFAALKGVG
jgi:hypothetical protein